MELIPTVNQAAEFLEISNDFKNPKEIIREAISNSFDAGSKNIKIEIYIDKSSGIDDLVINIEDDGEGMDVGKLNAFFGLGYSTRRAVNKLGNRVSLAIGEKGHGTKVYFNSSKIELQSWKNNQYLHAAMDSPRQKLRTGEIPKVIYETTAPKEKRLGSIIRICGYNCNVQDGFSHNEIRDYIYWFTKFGSTELEFGRKSFINTKISLRGLGAKKLEVLSFGHRFAKVNTDLKSLKLKCKDNNNSPLDYYVAKWVYKKEEVIGRPDSTLDFVFYIEGDKAKREYNTMLHQKFHVRKPGEYDVADRYGLWLCKDHMPVQTKGEWNRWVAEKSEWTKYHAFVNCQDFKLTANRGDIENTPIELLKAVELTVKELFNNKIKLTKEFKKFEKEQINEQNERTAAQEEADFKKRRKETLVKNAAKFGDTVLLEPRNEGGVFSLFMQLKTLRPDLFDFAIVDYDTGLGYDLLVTKDTDIHLDRASMMFVEMKYELKKNFDHSFGKLWAIVCWDCKLANGSDVLDISGKKRNMQIINKDRKDPKGYKKYTLVSRTSQHKIEVFVLKDYLKDKLGLDFRPRGR
jgi:hypothetical protein